jgi:hypothetical protein
LRPFILNDESEPAADDSPRSLTFALNRLYRIDEDGYRRPRNVRQEVLNLQRGQEEQEAIEEALSQEPDEQLAAALEVVQAAHEASVASDMVQAIFRRSFIG